MKRKLFTIAQIFNNLKEFEAGKNIQDISRDQGVSKATIYNWKAKYGGYGDKELKGLAGKFANTAFYTLTPTLTHKQKALLQ